MNSTDLIDLRSLRDDVPDFAPGDTLKVHVRVVEGTRERVQVFQGAVIRRQGDGIRETFTVRKVSFGVGVVSTGDLEEYESEVELQLYREYKDVCPMFTYVVETERRFYLANRVDQQVRTEGGRTWIELTLEDAWVWDMYRQNRFVSSVTVVTFKDVNVEALPKDELEAPDPTG